MAKPKRSAPDPARSRTALLAKYAKHLAAGGLGEDDATEYVNVVGSAIDFKGFFFSDPSPVTWPADSTIELVRDLMPGKVVADSAYAEAVVPALTSYLEFLVTAGRLKSPGPDAERIAATLTEQRAAITTNFLDPGTKSPASRLAMLAQQEGVDLSDERQMDAFVHRFNDMPQDWRDQAFGMVADTPASPLTPDAEFEGSPITGLDGESGPTVHLPAVTEEDEMAAFGQLGLWWYISAAVQWLSPGRRVGEDSMPTADEMPGLLTALGSEEQATSLWDIDWGVDLWLTLRELDLVRVTDSIARPGQAAAAWPAEGPGSLKQGRDLVAAFTMTTYFLVAMRGKVDERLGDNPAGAYLVSLAFAAQPAGTALPNTDFDPDDPDASVEDLSRYFAYESMMTLEWAGILTTDLTGTRWVVRRGLQRALAPVFETGPMAVVFE